MFFDFGGVVLSSPFEAFSVYEQRVGLPPNAVRTVNATNPDDNAWARFERSEISLDEFVKAFEIEAMELGYDMGGVEILRCLEGDLRPEMVDVVRRCQQRFVTAMLTNNVVSMSAAGFTDSDTDNAERPASRFDAVLPYFDHIIESSVVGYRKPQVEFYELACERAKVTPDRVVFLDDLGVNLKPAKAMGMTTIKVLSAEQAIDDLSAVLGIDLRTD